ncbi:SGNH/GDSL hydrolase family protein [Herbiconiux sp. SYSU D00978]|uniref:SGNH/GDSL hydrolase family protein n=1 Tax=Herbiconiux sp. SYSU D00978 TaxID=2812562 RepID=UPI001A969748|nr:SGNH/GDSL hydrolase family protein [Herbiconiux sp. SYSU D00978]
MKDWIRVALGVLMSLGIVALLVMAFLPRQAPSTAAGEPAAEPTTAAPIASAPPSEPAAPVETAPSAPAITNITVIGDGWTSGSSANSGPDALWPALIGQQFAVETRPAGAPGSGYVASGSSGSTFLDLVQESDPATGAIVVFGSSNDSGATYDELYASAAELYEALAQRSPDAPVLVIGPAYLESAEGLSSEEITNRDAIRDAAVAAGLTFVDPVAEDWFAAEDPELVAANGVNPNDDGQVYLAERIAPSIQALLGR